MQTNQVNKQDLSYIYTRPDLFGTGTKLVNIGLAFIQDLADLL